MVASLTRRSLILMLLASCTRAPRFLTYDGPEVTQLRVYKAERRLELWHHDVMLREYGMFLGQNPIGHKEYEGDSRTPEGSYIIDRRNPQSAYHLSIGISYPDEDDIVAAAERGLPPGGDIFIHGRGPDGRFARGDWTAGCIAVDDDEIEEIYSMVPNGTPIEIYP